MRELMYKVPPVTAVKKVGWSFLLWLSTTEPGLRSVLQCRWSSLYFEHAYVLICPCSWYSPNCFMCPPDPKVTKVTLCHKIKYLSFQPSKGKNSDSVIFIGTWMSNQINCFAQWSLNLSFSLQALRETREGKRSNQAKLNEAISILKFCTSQWKETFDFMGFVNHCMYCVIYSVGMNVR